MSSVKDVIINRNKVLMRIVVCIDTVDGWFGVSARK